MDEKKLEALKTLMEKIHETMRISKEKQALIEEKEKKLYEETRIMMVEKGKAELEELKKEKKEPSSAEALCQSHQCIHYILFWSQNRKKTLLSIVQTDLKSTKSKLEIPMAMN